MQEKNQTLNICNQDQPNSKINTIQLQQVSSLEINLINNRLSLQIPVAAARNSIPQILSSKVTFEKKLCQRLLSAHSVGPKRKSGSSGFIC